MGETNARVLEEFEVSATYMFAIANIKHSPVPSQINIIPHIKDLFNHFLLLGATCLAVNK